MQRQCNQTCLLASDWSNSPLKLSFVAPVGSPASPTGAAQLQRQAKASAEKGELHYPSGSIFHFSAR